VAWHESGRQARLVRPPVANPDDVIDDPWAGREPVVSRSTGRAWARQGTGADSAKEWLTSLGRIGGRIAAGLETQGAARTPSRRSNRHGAWSRSRIKPTLRPYVVGQSATDATQIRQPLVCSVWTGAPRLRASTQPVAKGHLLMGRSPAVGSSAERTELTAVMGTKGRAAAGGGADRGRSGAARPRSGRRATARPAPTRGRPAAVARYWSTTEPSTWSRVTTACGR
jgi:hypothetical protein